MTHEDDWEDETESTDDKHTQPWPRKHIGMWNSSTDTMTSLSYPLSHCTSPTCHDSASPNKSSPAYVRGRLQEHFSWDVSPGTLHKALQQRLAPPFTLETQFILRTRSPPHSRQEDREGSVIAFQFSLSDDDDGDDDEWVDQAQEVENDAWKRESQYSRYPVANIWSRQRHDSVDPSTSPLAALLSLPLPSYEPLTPPGHRLQECGLSMSRLAVGDASEEWSRTSVMRSCEGENRDQKCDSSYAQHPNYSPFRTSPLDIVRDQPLSATLRRLGAKRKTLMMVELEAEEDCIFASEQKKAFATGRFDARLPKQGVLSSGYRLRDRTASSAPRGVPRAKGAHMGKLAGLIVGGARGEEAEDVPRLVLPATETATSSSSKAEGLQEEGRLDQVKNVGRYFPSSILGDDCHPPLNLPRPPAPREPSRWTRLADGWGGLLPPRDWFQNLALGPLISPSVAKSTASTAMPETQVATEDEQDAKADLLESESRETDRHVQRAEAGVHSSTMKKKYKSLLLTKLREAAEESRSPPSALPLPTSPSSSHHHDPLQTTLLGTSKLSKKDKLQERENGKEWEDIWTCSDVNGAVHAQKLLNHLLDTPLVASDPDRDKVPRKVRFASFLPTLKQATRLQLHTVGSEAEAKAREATTALPAEEDSGRRVPTVRTTKELPLGGREGLPEYARTHFHQRAAAWRSTPSAKGKKLFTSTKTDLLSLPRRPKEAVASPQEGGDIELGVLPSSPDAKDARGIARASESSRTSASPTRRLPLPRKIIGWLETSVPSSPHSRRSRLLLLGLLLSLLLTILILSILVALLRSQLAASRRQTRLLTSDLTRVQGEEQELKETLGRLAANVTTQAGLAGLGVRQRGGTR